MIARRIDRDRQIFEQHVEKPRPFRHRNTAQALADVAVTSMMRYMALSGQVVPLHAGMRAFGDDDAPWALIPSSGWRCPSCRLWATEDERYCGHCDRKRPVDPELELAHMCIHETTQMTDEHRIIICADCSREFARVTRDERETLVVPIQSQRVLLVPGSDDLSEWPEFAVHVEMDASGNITMVPVYPCAKCGYDGTCHLDGEDCHT